MKYKELKIIAAGGCLFNAHLVGDDDTRDLFLGSVEVGEVDEGGEWIGDDDDVTETVRTAFGDRIPSGIAVRVF